MVTSESDIERREREILAGKTGTPQSERLATIFVPYRSWVREPDDREVLLDAIAATEVSPDFAYRVASRMVAKMPEADLHRFALREIHLETARQKLLREVVIACLGLIVMSVFTLCIVTIAGYFYGKTGGSQPEGGGQNPQMLLTVFTTVFAFLTGRFMSQLGDRRVKRQNHHHTQSKDFRKHQNPPSGEARTNGGS